MGDGRSSPVITPLVGATLYTFGLKRGVGMDTMSKFSLVCVLRGR